MDFVEIPCPHESGEVSGDSTVSDHHPLSEEEVIGLLELAHNSRGKMVSKIQVRLGQGIVGMLCPRPIDSPVGKKLAQLDQLFVAAYDGITLTDPNTAKRLCEIMSQ